MSLKIARNIKRIRKESGMTQTEFSKVLGCSQVSIWAWENNKREPKYDARIAIYEFAKRRGIKVVKQDWFSDEWV